MKTNKNQLIRQAVQGQVVHSRCYGWEISQDGAPMLVPGAGGITYNIKVGDPAFGWVSDHVEPCVSFTASRDKLNAHPNKAFNAYACVGNDARLISGAAKGRKGVVTGHHGGLEHVIIDFPDDVLRKLTEDDKVLVEGFGMGLKISEAPEVACFGLSPRLLSKMKIRVLKDGKLEIPVTAVIPPELMGSGTGELETFKGDYDLQTQDAETLRRYKLDALHIGDFVLMKDQDNRFGFGYRRGAVSVGIVVHGDSVLTGHGPGIQVLMTSPVEALLPRIAAQANIANYLGIGRFKKS